MLRLQALSDALARWSLLLIFGLLPFFFVPVQWITIAQSKMALIIILLFLATLGWLVSRLIQGNISLPARIVFTAAAFLPLAYLISVLVSGTASLSLVGTGVEQDTLASSVIWFAALALAAIFFSENPRRSMSALNSFFIGGFVLVVLQALHIFFPNALSFGGVLTGQTGNAFGSWHDLGILLGFFVFLGTALILGGAGEGRMRYVYISVAAISLLLLIVANLFDVWLALAAISLLYLVYRAFKEKRTSGSGTLNWGSQKYWIAIVIVSLFFAVFGNFINNILPAPLKVVNLEVRPSWQGTIQISQQSLVSASTLLFGVGPNTFTQEWGLHKPVDINSTPFWNADFSTGIGSIPTSFITVGLIGFLAWIALLAVLLWLARRVIFAVLPVQAGLLAQEGGGRMIVPIAFSVIYLFAFYVMYSPGPALSIFAFLALGLLVASAASANAVPVQSLNMRGDWTGRARMLGAIVAGLIIVFAGVGIARALLSDVILNRGIVAYNNTGDIEKASALVAQSIKVSPQNDRAQRSAIQLGLLQLQKLIATADPKDENSRELLQKTISDTIQHGLDAVSINGSAYQNWLELAALYGQLAGANIEGAYDNARQAYSRAQAENPTNPFPFFQLAQLEILQNKPDTALQYLLSAVQLKADFAPAYYVASQIYAANNDLQNATGAATQAVRYASDDPLGWYNLGTIYYAGKDYANASVALQQALVRQPQYSNAIYLLGLTYYQLGDTGAAIKSFEDLDKLNPDQQIIKDVLDNLRAGKPPLPAAAAPAQTGRR